MLARYDFDEGLARRPSSDASTIWLKRMARQVEAWRCPKPSTSPTGNPARLAVSSMTLDGTPPRAAGPNRE
jgi:hypothetical protein